MRRLRTHAQVSRQDPGRPGGRRSNRAIRRARTGTDAYVTFILGADGNVESIRMKAVSPATDFSYDIHDLDLRRRDE
jgi:hypothetical protein